MRYPGEPKATWVLNHARLADGRRKPTQDGEASQDGVGSQLLLIPSIGEMAHVLLTESQKRWQLEAALDQLWMISAPTDARWAAVVFAA